MMAVQCLVPKVVQLFYLSTDMNTLIPNPGLLQMSGNPLSVLEGLNPSTSNLVPSPSGPGASCPSASTIEISSQTPSIPIPANNQPSSSTSDPSNSIQPQPSSTTTSPAINPQNIQSPMTNTAVNGIVTSANVQTANMMHNFNPHEDQHGLLLSGWEHQVDHLGCTYYVEQTFKQPSGEHSGSARNRHCSCEP